MGDYFTMYDSPRILKTDHIEASIKLTNKIWNDHRNEGRGFQPPLLKNLKKCLEDKEQNEKHDSSRQRKSVDRKISFGNFRTFRPTTVADNQGRGTLVIGTQKTVDHTLPQASPVPETKRYYLSRGFKVKEKSISNNIADETRSKASIDVPMSAKIGGGIKPLNSWRGSEPTPRITAGTMRGGSITPNCKSPVEAKVVDLKKFISKKETYAQPETQAPGRRSPKCSVEKKRLVGLNRK